MITALLSPLLFAAFTVAGGQPTQVYRCTGEHAEVVFSGYPCGNSPQSSAYDNAFDVRQAWDGACASTADELLDQVATAFDSGNVNTLAGLFLWRGYATRSAYSRMRELGKMLQQPLAALHLVGSRRWQNGRPAYAAWPVETPVALIVSVADARSDGSHDEYRFKLLDSSGCVWLGFDDSY